jgi:hypothetical protein
MDNIFIFNLSADKLDIIDAINERITKIKTLTACLLFACYNKDELDNETVCGVAWTIEDFIKELELLHEQREIFDKKNTLI